MLVYFCDHLALHKTSIVPELSSLLVSADSSSTYVKWEHTRDIILFIGEYEKPIVIGRNLPKIGVGTYL